jgi:hypothetical protein
VRNANTSRTCFNLQDPHDVETIRGVADGTAITPQAARILDDLKPRNVWEQEEHDYDRGLDAKFQRELEGLNDS